jgi:hypothetical protein
MIRAHIATLIIQDLLKTCSPGMAWPGLSCLPGALLSSAQAERHWAIHGYRCLPSGMPGRVSAGGGGDL